MKWEVWKRASAADFLLLDRDLYVKQVFIDGVNCNLRSTNSNLP